MCRHIYYQASFKKQNKTKEIKVNKIMIQNADVTFIFPNQRDET